MNLYEFIKRNSFRGMSSSLIKDFSKQILGALSLLQKNSIIHCDLKPENILLCDSKLESIKLIDFGTSCFSDQKAYSYIQSRFYRAPEIILGIPYTTAIDMWSFGCILTEMYTGIPIFPAGDEHDLISLIAEVIGEPPKDLISQGSRIAKFFTKNGHSIPYINENRKRRSNTKERSLNSILKGADESFINLIRDCLVWDPKLRITPDDALNSEWFTEIQDKKTVQLKKKRISMDDLMKRTPKLKKYLSDKGIK